MESKGRGTDLLKEKWKKHRDHARDRGLGSLTFTEYQQKAFEANITADMIGRTKGSYVLGRYTDFGDYTSTSCRFVTIQQNHDDMIMNGGREAKRKAITGRTKENNVSTAKMADTIKTKRANGEHDHVTIAVVESTRKPYKLISPEGVLFEGLNLRKFCRDNNLSENGMYYLKNGRIHSHNGWKRG